MGSFDSNWGLGRTLGMFGTLGTASQVSNVQAINNWLTYSNTFERTEPHSGAHNWVGGAMAGPASPNDPIFYLHHGMVDKLWQEWVDANNITPNSNIYQITNMPRYDGTYTFNGVTLPAVNPDNIVDGKLAYGTFFAENQLAVLEGYTVSNTYNTTETFYYQYLIRAGNGFVVPNGKNAKFESVNQVLLEPGFSAAMGSNFIAKIDEDSNVFTEKSRDRIAKIIPSYFDYSALGYSEDAYKDIELGSNSRSLSDNKGFSVYPNPSKGLFNYDIGDQNEGNYRIEVVDISGKVVLRTSARNINSRTLNLNHISNGVYIVNLIKGQKLTESMKIIKH